VQCVDRHGHEDKTHIFMYILYIFIAYYLFVQCVDRHSHKDRALICAVCRQT